MLHFLADWYHIILKLEDSLLTTPAISLFTNEDAKAQRAEVTVTKEADSNPKSLDWIVQSVSLQHAASMTVDSRDQRKGFMGEEEIKWNPDNRNKFHIKS